MNRVKTPDDFRIVKKNLSNSKLDYVIEKRTSSSIVIQNKRKTVIYRNMAMSNIEYFKDKSKVGIIRAVHAQINNHIKKVDLDVEVIKSEYPSADRNHKAFAELPNGTELCVVDISHAYWRFAYLKGYITENTYKKYATNPEFKLARNIALSTITSLQDREYYIKGKLFVTVGCEKNLHKTIYKNVRYLTYNTTGHLAELLDSKCFSYRVDGILALYDFDVVRFCKDYFKERNLFYKITRCTKINDTQIQEVDSGRIKKF